MLTPSMPALVPYQALYFFAADDVGEVNRENKAAYDDDGFLRHDVQADMVTVVAAEYDHQRTGEYVWALRDGKLERLDSWMVRKYE